MNQTEDEHPGNPVDSRDATSGSASAADDSRVIRALHEYQAALKAGQKPNRQGFQGRYPEIAEALAECLDGLEFVRALAPHLSQAGGDLLPAAPPSAVDIHPEGPLGDYRLVREIGRGGMGVVYEAVQISLGRRVALKVLPFAAALDARQLQRFKNEAQAAAHLHHTNIVPVYGVGCERGVHYYAMQFIDGQTLAAMITELRTLAGRDSADGAGVTTAAEALAAELASGRWAPPGGRIANPSYSGPAAETASPPVATLSGARSSRSPAYFRTVAGLGVQAATALEHAHGMGVVHRDVKPANLLLDGRGNLWVTDFGLAHCQSQAGLTMTGDLVGTLRYMSPEQALAQRVGTDHRTDVYSLGVTLYELLTLEPVFDGRDRQELLRQIAFDEPRLPRRLNKAVPAELETIVLKAIEKNPADRYATAQELADDLERFLKDESIRAKRPSLVQRARKWARRHQSLVWSVLVATLVVLLLAVVMLALSTLRSHAEQKRTAEALGQAQHEEREKSVQLWQAMVAQARANRLSRRAGQRFESLDILQRATQLAHTLDLPAEKFQELRNAAIATLALPDLYLAGPWNPYPADTCGFAFDEAHAIYARTDRQGNCSIRRVADDAEIHRTLTREVVIALHPTEPLLAVCSYFSLVVQVRDVRTGKVVASLPQSTRVSTVAWHPDGRTLAVGYAESHQIRLYDRTTWQAYRTLETEQAVSWIDFDHAGDRLAITGWVGFLELFDVGTGQKLMGTPPILAARRFSRDGRRLAGGVQDGKLGIWQVGDGREYRTLIRKALPEKDEYRSVAVSLDGRLLAAGMTDGFGLWDLGSGSELAFIPGGDRNNFVLFEPSGALLTLSAAGLARWPVAKELNAAGEWSIGPPEPLPLPPGHDLGQSRDGRVIVTCDRAVSSQQPYAGGWILHADRPDQPIPLDAGADIAWITVSPDGRWVVTVTLSPQVTKIWDARDGRLVKQLADWGSGSPRFSPDGRWLATGLDGGRLFAVETGEPGPRVGGAGVFAPDSKLMAVAIATGVIRLVDPATGRELATLEDPNLDCTYLPVFTPDGTRLISYSNGKVKGIHVWDLRLLRRHLAEMGLDWDAPPYPPADPGSKAARPLRVQLLRGDPATLTLSREQKACQAIASCRRAVGTSPDSADGCNNLAWAYLTAPEALRDVKAALPLAEKAVRLAPGNAGYRNTLGVACYRAGRYREAVEALRPNLENQEDGSLACDLYFLAMSHHRLGETARARDCYTWAVRWTRAHPTPAAAALDELNRFQVEAAELLEIGKKKD
jgi:serine/threonine protein kinase/WD40 repeat protein/Tfp pilus assembly protein PilF